MDLGTPYGLAFVSGINAYLPLLSLALAANFWPDRFKLNPDFSILTQPWVIAILAILTVVNVFADKIPGVDHAWDAIHTILRPAAGAIVAAAASAHAQGGWLPIVLILGGGIAAATHTTKAATRVTSTVTTAGCMNIVLSIAEDVMAIVGVFLALLAPYIMVFVVIIFVTAFLLLIPKLISIFRKRRQPQAAYPRVPTPGGRSYPRF